MNTAAGIVLMCDGKVLLLQRLQGDWGLPGGKIEAGETPLQGAIRETAEECGYLTPADAPVTQLTVVDNPDGFRFTVFALSVPNEFAPTLSDEHSAASWFPVDALPGQMFMGTEGFIQLACQATGMDYADTSARRVDNNGWYTIPNNPLSKVGVYQYLGKNIPGADPARIYKVLRPAEELGSAATIESIKLTPWINDHVMLGSVAGTVAAEKKGVQGVIGQDVYFKDGTLYGNLKLFSAEHGATIDSGKNQLSLGYRCKYEHAPGVFNGEAYDYVQRQIRGNHVASVMDGRMGPEVAVLDHFSFTFDAKDAQIMADEKAPEGKSEGGAKPSLEDAVAALNTLIPLMQKLAAATTPTPAEPAAVVDAEPQTPPEKTEPAAIVADKKEEIAAMDASEITGTVFKAIAARDVLVKKLTPFVGAFDHSEMTPGEVVAYGIKKLEITAPVGAEAAYLDGYLAAKPAPGAVHKPAATFAMDGADAPAARPAFMASQVE